MGGHSRPQSPIVQLGCPPFLRKGLGAFGVCERQSHARFSVLWLQLQEPLEILRGFQEVLFAFLFGGMGKQAFGRPPHLPGMRKVKCRGGHAAQHDGDDENANAK
jgi:hypothetical protein